MENARQFRERLKAEGRWGEFVRERAELCETEGIKPPAAKKRLLEKYAPLGLAEAAGSTNTKKISPQERYKDMLPDGTPIVDANLWLEKAKISIIDEFEWVHDNLGKIQVRIEDAPSLAAWRMYYQARYSTDGLQYFKSLYTSMVIPDKSTLKERQGRRDDNRVLTKLHTFADDFKRMSASG